MTADLANAAAAASGTSIQLVSLQAAMSADNTLTPGSVARSQALAALASSRLAIDQQITRQSEMVTAPFGADVAVAAYGPSLNRAVVAAGALAAAVNAASYVGRISRRLTSTGG